MRVKSYQRVFLYLLSVLLLTAILSPWAAALWDLILSARPEWQEYRYPFSRIFSRLYMVLAIVLFFPSRRLLKIGSMSQLGLQPLRQGYRDLLIGFSLALASVIALVLAMSLSEVFTPYFRLSLSVGLERSFKALLTALTVGFLEEIFFRGIIFKGLLEDWRPMASFVAASLFYSAIHFVKPAKEISLAGLDPWAGRHQLIYSFQPFLDPIALFPGLSGLFIIGIVLSYAFLRTSSLYLSIGLHAGWIFAIKSIRVYGDFRREDLGWIFGSSNPKIVSGVATWIGILAVGVIVHWMTRKRKGLK
ncbi:MAG: lysostaphin resistance A-like protein [Candidatus Binatia bacterium]